MDRKSRYYEISRVLLRLLPFGRSADEILSLVYRVNFAQRDLDKQVEEAVNALTNSTNLISSLEQSLEERAKKLSELKAEYERVSSLAEITEEQGAAVARTLERALGKGQVRERWIAFAINVLAGLIIFVLGVFASEWVKGIPGRLAGSSAAVSTEASTPDQSQ